MRRKRSSLAHRKTTDVAKGSLSDVAVKEDISLAEAFAGARLIILFDVSGSMGEEDAPSSDGLISRHEAAEMQVRQLQEKYDGKVALFCFSNDVMFAPNGVPIRLDGLTAMNNALKYIKRADGIGIDIIMISDGGPTDGEDSVLRTARTFKQKIDCIYIGGEDSYDRMGKEFLRKLADATGGRFVKTEEVAVFYADVEQLMLTS